MSSLARRSLLVAAVTGLTATACQPPAPPAAAELDDLLRRWTAAVLAADRRAHAALWAAGEAPDSLLDLDLVAFDATRSGADVAVDWRPRDSDSALHHDLVIEAVRDPAGSPVLRFGPATPGVAVPLWRAESVTRVDAGTCHLLVGGPGDVWAGRPVAHWTGVLTDAANTAAARSGRPPTPVWAVLPSSTQVLSAILGGADAARAGAAAYTTVMGEGPVQVLLDPTQLGALAEAGARALLVHELVHVVTDAPYTPLPTWVEEGYAEAVTWADDETNGWSQVADLLARVRDRPGDPVAVPSDAEFAGDPLAYGIAWTRCRWQLDHGGWSALRQWYDLQAPPVPDRTAVDEAAALHQVYGLDVATRDRRWWAWLVQRAAA